MMEISNSTNHNHVETAEVLPVIDAFLVLQEAAEQLGIDISDPVKRAHGAFARDEAYYEHAPHNNDRWHMFLNLAVPVLEGARNKVDPLPSVVSLLDQYIDQLQDS